MADVSGTIAGLNRAYPSISLIVLRGSGFATGQQVNISWNGTTPTTQWSGTIRHAFLGGAVGVARVSCVTQTSTLKPGHGHEYEHEQGQEHEHGKHRGPFDSEQVSVTVANGPAAPVPVEIYSD